MLEARKTYDRLNAVHTRSAEGDRFTPVEILAEGFKLALIVGAALAVLALPERVEAARISSDPEHPCQIVHDAARDLMAARQAGVERSDPTIRAMWDSGDLGKAMVLDAYARPLVGSAEDYVEAYADLRGLQCLAMLDEEAR